MVRVFSILGLLWGVPMVTLADPLFVQSGEHDKFTRLVTPLPDGTQWRVNKSGNQVTVTMEGHADGFNTGDVFDRIPRARIEALKQDADQLTLSLACDCNVATFLDRGSFLVLDVAEKGVPLEGTFVQVEEITTEPQVVEVAPKSAPARSELRLPPLPVTLPKVVNTLNFSQPSLDRGTLREREQFLLSEMQDRLAKELGTAATRGVLTPKPGRVLPHLPQLIENEEPVEIAIVEEVLPETGPLSNVRISSSLDRPAYENNAAPEIAGFSCPAKGTFDVMEWGTKEPFALQIANAREGLYGELDRLNTQAAVQLAQRYLYFGFGAEAKQILELDPTMAKEHAPLLIMADILDGLPPRDASLLTRAIDCPPEVVLWATLAKPNPVSGAKPDADAALLALSNLPLHLREIIAPALSAKLLAYGDSQSAAQALRSLERTPVPLQPLAKLAQAELNLHNGDSNSGRAQLEEVVASNTEQSPAALIALVDAQIAVNQPIEMGVTNLVAAYAQELRDTEQGPELRRAHILGLLKAGQFDEAFAANADLGGNDNSDSARKLRAQLVRDLTATANDIVFLDHIFTQRETDIKDLPAEDLSALAERFLATGFPERAEQTLGYLPIEKRALDDKLLSARIALELGKPMKAQADLLGIDGDVANTLRADAKRMSGAHDEAHDLYMQSDQLGRAAEAAWLSDNWQGLTTTEMPVFGAASSLARYGENPTAVPTGMLARTAAALSESETARQILADLLDAAELQVQPEN